MSKLVLEGMFVPCVTPFTRSGRLDVEALKSCVHFWLEAGVSGLVPCGSNGEAPYLSRQERIRVIKTVVDEANGKALVIPGTGSMSTQETVKFTADATDLGVDAVLIVTPFYFKLSNREIQEHYLYVSERVDIPIVVYNVPKFTGISLEPAAIQKLAAESKKIIGVKDSAGNIGAITETIRLTGNRISVLAGTADVALPTLLAGGKGAVLAVANVFPTLCGRLYAAFKNGRYEEAGRLQSSISFANEVLVKRFNQIAAIKEAMQLQELTGGFPRKPTLPLKTEERKMLQRLLKQVNMRA
jgi:4-hydroxy-tetrahydrodipicolinate synthase